MKKLILTVGILIAIATSTTSCKKDYTCKCSKTYSNGSHSSTYDYSTYVYKDTRKRAEDRCNANESTSSDLYGDYSINCQIDGY